MSTAGPTFTNADDAKLVAMVASARQRVLLLAPGVSAAVAAELQAAWRRLGPDRVDVILDIDPEVCRLGYGTIDAVESLRAAAAAAGTMLHHQPGVRIGVLICDDRVLVYSPTPLLIEAGATQPTHPNAIEINQIPESVAKELGLGAQPNLERTVGLDPVRADQITAARKSLETAPPVKFDLARRVRVFTQHFQFVELTMTGCSLSRRKVAIPSHLMGLANTGDVEKQFHAQFDLLQGASIEVKTEDNKWLTESLLLNERLSIEREFLNKLPNYGAIVLKANKDEFLKRVEDLKMKVEAFAEGARTQIDELIEQSIEVVVGALLPAVERNPPMEYRKVAGPNPSPQFLKNRLEEDIKKALGSAETMIKKMEVSVLFKDVTYESLGDPDFLAAAQKAMPGVQWLHDEFEATRASETEGKVD